MNKQLLKQFLLYKTNEGLYSLYVDGMHNWIDIEGNRAIFVDHHTISNNNGNIITLKANTTIEHFCDCIPEGLLDEIFSIIEMDENGQTRDSINEIFSIIEMDENGQTREYMDY